MDSQRRTGVAEPLLSGDPENVGSYAILGRIGEGGMGAVYLGRHPDGRRVAVKVVRPELAQDAGFVARFRDEVANAQRVASFCTAQVLDHGESGGRAYMVTEFIDGVSLKEYVNENGELSSGMLQGVAVGVAAALVAIHSAGLIHRDLKPANVLLSFSGPRVIDFGIARALDAADGHTMTGQMVGSPGWMAPEQIMQQQVTTAVDVFAWGCLVAYAANGINPFGKGDFSVMAARLVHGDPQIGALPAPLDRLVQAALDKNPRNRPTAKDLLLTMVGGDSPEAAVLATLTPSWQPPAEPPPAPPTARQGDTRVADDDDTEDRSLVQGTPPPYSEPTRTPYGTPARAESPPSYGAPPSPPYAEPTRSEPPYAAPAPSRSEAPTAYGPPGQGTSPSYSEAPTAYGPAAGRQGAQPNAALAATSVAPADAPPTMPTRAAPPPRGPKRGKRGVLAAAVVVVVAAASVTGWLLLKSGGGSPGTSHTAAGPAPLPTSPMLVRIDGQAGWPDKCYGNVGEMVPGSGQVKYLLKDPSKCDILPQWSPDHQRITFTRSTGSVNEVWIMNADGSGAKMVSNQVAGRNRLAWSPDGTKIAVMGKNSGGQRQIYIVDANNPSSATPLTTDASNKDDPAWCKDRIVFWSDKSGSQQIYTTDATKPGADWTQVTDMGHSVNDPSWSPDCSKIAYTDQPGGVERHIWVTNADGTGNHQLTTTGRDMDPTWSPNGTWIAFSRGLTQHPRTWAIRTDGTGERSISPEGRDIGHPDWR